MNIKFLCFGVFFAVFAAALVFLPTSSADSGSLTPHDPIDINYEGDFTEANGVVNPGAAGTVEDPYVIEGWIIDASDAVGIDVTYTDSHFVIRNCVIEDGAEDNYYDGISIHYLKEGFGIVENNRLINNNGGVTFANVSNCVSRKNVFRNNSAGMRVINAENIVVENNRIENGGEGLWIANSSEITLAGNTVEGTSGLAFQLLGSSYCVLENDIAKNCSSGFVLTGSSNNVIKNNRIEGNFGYGFRTEDSPDPNVDDSSNNNQIYRNFFVNNGGKHGGVQAYDKYTNYWAIGGTGNYWSDWQPPSHPDSNGDGIVDEDKAIEGGANEDDYPLVFPEGYSAGGDVGGDEENDSVEENVDDGGLDSDNVDGSEGDDGSGGIPNILISVLIVTGGLAIAYPVNRSAGRKAATVVVVVALVAGIGVFMISEDDVGGLPGGGDGSGGGLESSTGLPVHDEASKANLPSEVESDLTGYFGEDEIYDVYLVDASREDVCSWYDTEMINAGWALPDVSPVSLSSNLEANDGYGAQAVFQKDDIDSSVSVGGTQSVIASAKQEYGIDLDISGTLIVLEADGVADDGSGSTGDDDGNGGTGSGGTGTETGLPVYPGASEKSLSSGVVEPALVYGCGGVPREVYVVDGSSLEDVKSWYKSRMSDEGWTLSMEGDYEPDYRGKWQDGGKIATVWILTQEMVTAQEMNYGVEIDISSDITIVLAAWDEAECDF